MAHNITLEQAETKAYRVEVILLMLAKQAESMEPCEVSAVLDLVNELSHDVSTWFVGERARKESSK